jgi:RimJ/RimL family protein N-acetyltransferase
MESRVNACGQPIGAPLENWQAPPWPKRQAMVGRYCRVEGLDPERDAEDLHTAMSADSTGRLWTYFSYGPFATCADYRQWMEDNCRGEDPLFYVIRNATDGAASGVASYLRIAPASGSIEVGNILYSPALQQSTVATEAMYLMMRAAFELGYRRYEWKCDSLNAPSRAAALRLGFSFEGIFRQATVYKGRNRDTAWYAILDNQWPNLQEVFLTWLDPSNFDQDGRQRQRLSVLTRAIRDS